MHLSERDRGIGSYRGGGSHRGGGREFMCAYLCVCVNLRDRRQEHKKRAKQKNVLRSIYMYTYIGELKLLVNLQKETLPT